MFLGRSLRSCRKSVLERHQNSDASQGEKNVFSTASGALVVGGVRDICSSMEYPGDRFECSMEYNQSASGSLW